MDECSKLHESTKDYGPSEARERRRRSELRQSTCLLGALAESRPVLGHDLVEDGVFGPAAGVVGGVKRGRLEEGRVCRQAHQGGGVPVACRGAGRMNGRLTLSLAHLIRRDYGQTTAIAVPCDWR